MASSKTKRSCVDDWQSGKTVTECNLHMLTTEDCSDVIFRVGSDKHVVQAHRYVLVSRSCVFHAMFCGPLAEKGEVTIPDIEITVFKEFLRYVYTDIADITADNVCGLLYTSRKYAVDALLDKCTHFLETSLSEDNVCQILEQCHIYRDLDLEQKALTILTEAGEKVVRSSGFLGLCSDCLGTFVKSVDLRLKEEQIFEAILSWTKHSCQKCNVPVTHEHIRKHLGNMVYDIRFNNMSLDYLVNVVGQSNVLSDSERINILDRLVRPSVDISPFVTIPRKKIQPLNVSVPYQYAHRFNDIQCGWSPEGTSAVSFRVSKTIYLVGCQLYGSRYKQNDSFDITVKLKEASVVYELFSSTSMILQGRGELNDILFHTAVTLEADSTYTLCVRMTGTTWAGARGQKSVQTKGVVFTFTESLESTTETTVEQGQIPGIIFQLIK